MTQCDMILKYINDFGSISSMEAFKDIGCTSLHRRISDLKERGLNFDFKWESGKNRYGKKVSWKRYWLKGKSNG